MSGWSATVAAIALVLIAIAAVALVTMIYIVLTEARDRGERLAREIEEIRGDLAPTLDAVKRFGEQGLDVARLAQEEAHEIIDTTRRIRYDVERGVQHLKERLADFDAVVDVVQEEVEETALQVTTALHTARSGAGMIAQLRRLIRPGRRGAA